MTTPGLEPEVPEQEAVTTAIRELCRIAPYEGSALRFAARPMADGALVGPAGERLGQKIMGWHEQVGQAFTHAFERLTAAMHPSTNGFIKATPPHLDRLPPPNATPRAGVVGGDLDKLTGLAGGLRRAAGDLAQCADILAPLLTRAGVGTEAARTIGDIATQVGSEVADVERRRDELAKRPDPVFMGELRGKGPVSLATGDAPTAEMPPAGEVKSVVDAMIARGVLPPQFATMKPAEAMRYLEKHPEVAVALGETKPESFLGGVATILATARGPVFSTQGSKVDLGRDQIRAAFREMSPAERRWTAILFPAVVGNLGGAPFSERIWANRVNIIRATADQEAKVQKLEAELKQLRALGNNHPIDSDRLKEAEQHLKVAELRLETFRNLLEDVPTAPGSKRQILVFDPDHGKIAELQGKIGPATKNVGVLVPGTGNNMDNFIAFTKTARLFVKAADGLEGPGSLAMISWLGGPLPQNLYTEAPHPRYAQKMAPDLAVFSRELAQEIRFAPTPMQKVPVTVAGHSYAGAVVGLAETFGLDADRVLHIESAGAGYGVTEGNAKELYKNPNPDVRRFSMTAPGDPIALTQGVSAFGAGHGADPDDLPGVTRLETGNYPEDFPDEPEKAGKPIEGLDSHSDVFIEDSDAWNNMYGVFTGGEIFYKKELIAPRASSIPPFEIGDPRPPEKEVLQ